MTYDTKDVAMRGTRLVALVTFLLGSGVASATIARSGRKTLFLLGNRRVAGCVGLLDARLAHDFRRDGAAVQCVVS